MKKKVLLAIVMVSLMVTMMSLNAPLVQASGNGAKDEEFTSIED